MTCFRPIWMVLEQNFGLGRSNEKSAIPCGQCDGCRMSRAQQWSNRMFWERDYWEAASFNTLTLENEPEDKSVSKRTLQLFFKKLRKKAKLSYYACGEYGETHGRPHYHAVIFGLGPQHAEIIEETWGLGQVETSIFNQNRALYTAGYLLKQVRPDIDLRGRSKPFCLMSQGIGKRFALANRAKIEQRTLTIYGKKVSTPRYYKTSLGIQMIEGEDLYGEAFNTHLARNPHLDPIKDQEAIRAEIEKSRHQAEMNWKADQSLRRHDNEL
ncbi:MAG: replication initiator protein [Arizlama microvirus]|nr:MAG: replication initiator protein [Arizlama microvirus]